ncbi:hypothetical protein [Nocardia sp. XZ_19_385]|uniref:hypothetical protein n=1 Tax=Nocardia sp. XZ_19_385 TaxID=2769488 RepID=UPI001E5DC950|nr:hypothetical protein [Nocardia sp. XZ_19_385]
MYRMPGARPLIAALALAIGLTGCGDSDSDVAQPNSTAPTTTTAATPTEDPDASPGKLLTADPTIVTPHPIPFTSWKRLAPDKLAVNFETGNPACYGVDVTTTETDKTVTIELRSGTRADAVGRMCTMEIVFATMEIPLKAALNDRKVLSAA